MTPSADARLNERGYLTPNMLTVLRYLSDKMDASSRSCGEAVIPTKPGRLPYPKIATVGASIAGHLRRYGLVTFLPDVRAWHITPAGRAALAAEGKEK